MHSRTFSFFLSRGYKYFFKPLAFKVDPEKVHIRMVSLGEILGKNRAAKKTLSGLLVQKNKILEQDIAGIKFKNPIGLSAGFDYEAKLTQIAPSIGFGFQSIGTITNHSYEGNTKPRLGRLPKSKSLMVNKGFKNPGAITITKKLQKLRFQIPLGVSIGRTNVTGLNLEESIQDIIQAFKTFESEKTKNSYYELNISCPNLKAGVDFYKPESLNRLLEGVDELKIKKPVFVKMPIIKSDKETLDMLDVISKHSPKGVIFGNLQNRTSSGFNKNELKKFKVGNFSGKPTFNRSNELIELVYKSYKERFVIIGCGGVFSAEDAYLKVKKGATLVQLITGMIFEGPQLISEINYKLPKLLSKDGFTHISQAIGSDFK